MFCITVHMNLSLNHGYFLVGCFLLSSHGRRYILDDESQIRTVLEEHGPFMNGLQEENHDTELSWLPKILKEFILPAGFPGDYYLPLSSFLIQFLLLLHFLIYLSPLHMDS